MKLNKDDYMDWVTKTLAKYCADREVKREISGKTIMVYDMKNRKAGFSKCHPKDKWNARIGIAIAYARTKGWEVPECTVYKKPTEIKNGEYFMSFGEKYMFVGRVSEDVYAVVCDNGDVYTAGLCGEIEMCEG